MACVVSVGNQDPNSAGSHVPPGCWTDIRTLLRDITHQQVTVRGGRLVIGGSDNLDVAHGLEELPLTTVSLFVSSKEVKLESIPRRARCVAARLER
ncbi:hypothetical protein ACLOJK_037073 [Asimina triloba]